MGGGTRVGHPHPLMGLLEWSPCPTPRHARPPGSALRRSRLLTAGWPGTRPCPHDPLAGAARSRHPLVGVRTLGRGETDRVVPLDPPPVATRGPGRGSGAARAQWSPRAGAELELSSVCSGRGGARGVLSGLGLRAWWPNPAGGVEPTLLAWEPDRPQQHPEKSW